MQGRGNALANHKETQEQMVEKTPNPQGGSYGTTLRTRALGFSIFEFNLWLGFPLGVQEIFILGTSLLVGLEALQTSPFRKYRSWNTSRGVQIGLV